MAEEGAKRRLFMGINRYLAQKQQGRFGQVNRIFSVVAILGKSKNFLLNCIINYAIIHGDTIKILLVLNNKYAVSQKGRA